MDDKKEKAAYPLPSWADKRSDGNYMEPGAQLCTRDGRRHGNAFVYDVIPHPVLGKIATIITDCGNAVRMTIYELKQAFYPPEFVLSPSVARMRANKSYKKEKKILQLKKCVKL